MTAKASVGANPVSAAHAMTNKLPAEWRIPEDNGTRRGRAKPHTILRIRAIYGTDLRSLVMLRTLAVVFLATASVLSAARAEFVIHHAGWQRLSESTRLGFVMGAMDRLTATMGGDAGWAAFYDGTRTCTTFRVRSTAGALEQAVGDTYRANPELWGLSAVSILQCVVHRLCEPEINQRRQAAGVESITSATYLANMMRPPVRWEGLEGA